MAESAQARALGLVVQVMVDSAQARALGLVMGVMAELAQGQEPGTDKRLHHHTPDT